MKKLLVLLFSLGLTACGGGGSGGGSGGSPFDGNYNGVATVVFSAPGIPNSTELITTNFTISGTTIAITDGEISGTGTLNPDGSFSIPFSGIDTLDGITCQLNLTFTGTVSGNTVTGNVSGSAPCSGFGISVTVAIQGSFSANRVGRAVANSSSMAEGIRAMLK